MRKIAVPLVCFFSVIVFYSCDRGEIVLQEGNATFLFSQKSGSNGRVSEEPAPAFVVLSIEDSKGRTQGSTKLTLLPFGEGYVSENLKLKTGKYQLTQFLILDTDGEVIYGAPLEGSDLAQYVADPLPIMFKVTEEGVQVTPQVLAVSENDKPEDFGYVGFGFDVVHKPSVVKIKVDAIILVGSVYYENIDANIRVKGFNSISEELWSKDYFFEGPEANTIEIKNGFHHYSIELVDKWGINDIQSDISAKDIWRHRAEGPLPATYVLGGAKEAKKLRMVITSRDFSQGPGIIYQPVSRSPYTYDEHDRVTCVRDQVYNSQTSQFDESSAEAFTYGTALKITTTILGRLHIEELHEAGKITKTLHSNNGLVWTATYTNNASRISVNYSLSNGNSFLYEFDSFHKNKINDKTTQQGELCSQGNYAYDRNINPFRHLGYLDFNFINWSANNIVTEDHRYLACSFPVITPVSHQYTYDQDGYPVRKITTYVAGSFEGKPPFDTDTSRTEKVEYYYD